MSIKSIVEILRELERKGFDGSLEIIYQAGRIVMLCKSAIQNQQKMEREEEWNAHAK